MEANGAALISRNRGSSPRFEVLHKHFAQTEKHTWWFK